ncbi:MAG TPA: PEPxxWA-CTERM sorting domain-containing protein [Sphingomonas sp.]
MKKTFIPHLDDALRCPAFHERQNVGEHAMPNITKFIATLIICAVGVPAHAASVSTYTYALQQYCCGFPTDVNSYSYNDQFSSYYDNGVIRYTNEVPVAKTTRSEITSTNGIDAESFARFDVTRGTIGAYVRTDVGYDGYSATSARANVSLLETLTFTVAGATAATRTPILLTFDWHGTFGGNVEGGGAYAAFLAGAGEARITATRYGNGYFSSASNYVQGDGGDRYQFSILYDLIGPAQSLPVFASMELQAHNGQIADFSNTAAIGLRLPGNVSFTTASGLFLSAAAVPEPAGWAMLILGFGLIGATLRRPRTESKEPYHA